MFRNILSILRRENLLKQATDEFEEMLSKAEALFKTAVDLIMDGKSPDLDVNEGDKQINKMEWEIRQKVLEHLIISNRREDASAALILTSAVIDIERIGDYSRNIIELANICPSGTIIQKDHYNTFKGIKDKILEIFNLTSDAYKNADAEKAKLAMDIHWQISEQCDSMFEKIAAEKGLTAEYPVIYTLLSRHLKRVSSHLKNIASSVVNPFPRMGFKPSEDGKDTDIG
jgi:phosphate transport system protein